MSSKGQADLRALRAFGQLGERDLQPAIAVGGFIVSGEEVVEPHPPAEETKENEPQRRTPAAGSTAGSRERSPTETAAACEAARAVGSLTALSGAEFDELF